MRQEPPPLSQKPEELIFDTKRYRAQAEELLKDAEHTIASAPFEASKAIARSLRDFPSEVLRTYWGHGVTRGDLTDQVAAMLSMLENKVYIGDAAPLADSGYADARTSGTFFVISRKGGTSLVKGLNERKPERVKVTFSSGEQKFGVRMDPGAFVLNGHVEALYDALTKKFPNERILRASELPAYIEEQERLSRVS